VSPYPSLAAQSCLPWVCSQGASHREEANCVSSKAVADSGTPGG
jgi:hypothetical protein